MKPGAVIVDLAVEQGGNVEGSELDKIVVKNGVKLVGIANLPALVAGRRQRALCAQRAQLSRPVAQRQDRRIRRARRRRDHQGHAGVRERAGRAAEPDSELPVAGMLRRRATMTAGVDPIVINLIVFVLAIFVGYHVVWNVTPALHTPLMSRDQRDLRASSWSARCSPRARPISTGAAGSASSR